MTKEIAIASGKGGTGKTFIASNLSFFLHDQGMKVVAVDADVEAPDLVLALGGIKKVIESSSFYGSQLPRVDYNKCIKCWRCIEACKFNALLKGENGPIVLHELCEGLGTCAIVCPVKAISFEEVKTGDLIIALSKEDIPVVMGELELGGENSGRLVYELRKRARTMQCDFIVIDSAPGIGCPVISSIVGVDVLIIVIEPTPQSLKGAFRLLEVAKSLDVRTYAILNKYDINPSFAREIEKSIDVDILGRIAYNDSVIEAYTSMVPLLKFKPESEIAWELRKIFKVILEEII
ncbi:MAG: hypothetical protein DRZ82_02020 [Thermoprotei archaeon]|nr:MAG: hypothetical protein DRZ82_02020 [Thermoprotei archaeon]